MLICQWEQVSSLHQVVVGLTNGGEITRCSVGPGACSSDDIARCAHASFQNLEAFCGGEQRELLGAGHGCWSRERKKGPSTAPTCYRHQRLAKHLRRRGDSPVSASLDDLDILPIFYLKLWIGWGLFVLGGVMVYVGSSYTSGKMKQ